MLKKILALAALLFSLSSFAAVDVNKASAAELDGIKGIGPSLSGKILKERNKGSFKDWPDLMHRVSGMGEKSSAKFSSQGLTVNGLIDDKQCVTIEGNTSGTGDQRNGGMVMVKVRNVGKEIVGFGIPKFVPYKGEYPTVEIPKSGDKPTKEKTKKWTKPKP